jgi:hypothetical protein
MNTSSGPIRVDPHLQNFKFETWILNDVVFQVPLYDVTRQTGRSQATRSNEFLCTNCISVANICKTFFCRQPGFE